MKSTLVVSRTQEEQEALASAARESMRRQIFKLLQARGLFESPELQACPRCGEPIIVISQAATWVRDRKTREPICAPCGTELAVLDLMLAGGDEIGGEG